MAANVLSCGLPGVYLESIVTPALCLVLGVITTVQLFRRKEARVRWLLLWLLLSLVLNIVHCLGRFSCGLPPGSKERWISEPPPPPPTTTYTPTSHPHQKTETTPPSPSPSPPFPEYSIPPPSPPTPHPHPKRMSSLTGQSS